jgi:hypothetical protein
MMLLFSISEVLFSILLEAVVLFILYLIVPKEKAKEYILNFFKENYGLFTVLVLLIGCSMLLLGQIYDASWSVAFGLIFFSGGFFLYLFSSK